MLGRRSLVLDLFVYAIFLTLSVASAADDASQFLILDDIPPYVRLTKTRDIVTDQLKTISGYTVDSGPGVLAGFDHYCFDDSARTYETKYQSDTLAMGMSVKVTSFGECDANMWLLHELEGLYRDNPATDRYRGVLRTIDNSRILAYAKGTQYSWISNNIVVDIDYTDLDKSKPEPLEVVTAYLKKYPSSIPVLTMDKAHDAQWIKDEMDRRLWLCDKWFMQLQLKKAEEKDVYREAVKSMNIFLDYREKYFSSFFTNLKAVPEKNLLAQFLMQNNGTGIRTKLKEYKDWWAGNKDKSISF